MKSNISPTAAAVVKTNRIKYSHGMSKTDFDVVIVEEPLQISLSWLHNNQPQKQVFTITMRTPGDDDALAMGLLLNEGVIDSVAQIDKMCYDENDDDSGQHSATLAQNQLCVYLHSNCQPQLADAHRQLISQSSCGICGKTSLRSIELKSPKTLDKTASWLDINQLTQLPSKLGAEQGLFSQTGGVHAAALFDEHYQLLDLKEDVGRHNAVDKVIGSQAQHQSVHSGKKILLVSGRVSFELVQKAIMAGYPVLIAVGAPSSLAINAAKRFDLTLIGFTKTDSFNVYHGHWRIQPANI